MLRTGKKCVVNKFLIGGEQMSVLFVNTCWCVCFIQVHLIDLSLSEPSKAPLSLSSLPQKSHSLFIVASDPPSARFRHTPDDTFHTKHLCTPLKPAKPLPLISIV